MTLPPRGPFDFPAPYGTRGIRITNEDDGPVLPCGYSYWANINAHAGEDHLLVFLGVDRTRGGAGPSLWKIDKTTEAVTPLGPIFAPEHPLSWATGEGWYWSASDPDVLYVSDLTHLYRYHVAARHLETVVNVVGMPEHRDEVLWQWHTAESGAPTHSATVKAGESGGWQPLGTIVYQEGVRDPWLWCPKRGTLDESQIDRIGDWLLIKENLDGQDAEDNRIIHVGTAAERVLMDREGAAGHSDNGYGYMVAADNWNAQPAVWRVWMFDATVEPQGRLVDTRPWEVQIQHVSHCNARPGAPETQWVLGSGAARSGSAAGNELVVIPLDGSLASRAIAPSMVDLDAPGGGDDYGKLPKSNLDPYGEYALWTSNHGSDRIDAFLVRIPPSTPPPDPPTPPPTWRVEGWGPAPIMTPLGP
jgi:hypothetical protein